MPEPSSNSANSANDHVNPSLTPPKVVALVGYMGSGKTTIGKELASRLAWRFADLDSLVEEASGRSIPDIFAESGEDAFRDLESEILFGEISSCDGTVLSCGGGAVLREENRKLLARIPTVFVYEKIDVLYIRTRGEGRPLRGVGMEEFAARYGQREPLYREVAGLTLTASGRGQYELAGEVARWLGL